MWPKTTAERKSRFRLGTNAGVRSPFSLLICGKTPSFVTRGRAIHHLESSYSLSECRLPYSSHRAFLLRVLKAHSIQFERPYRGSYNQLPRRPSVRSRLSVASI